MRLYIETSIVSFWYDSRAHNRDRKRSVRRLLVSCRRGAHQAFVSDVVLRELGQSREPYKSRDLRLIGQLGLLNLAYEDRPFARLVEAYLRDVRLARLPEADLQHMAIFSVSDLDAMVTLNLRHLANQIMLEIVRKVNHAQGIDKDLRIGPPDAFLPPPEAV